MLTYLIIASFFIIFISPIFFIGFLIETKQEKQRAKLRDEIARQSRH